MLRAVATCIGLLLASGCTTSRSHPVTAQSHAATPPTSLAPDVNAILQTPVQLAGVYVSPPTTTALRPSRMAVGYGSDLVIVWDLATRRELIRVRSAGPIIALDLSRRGDLLAVATGQPAETTRTVSIWNVTTRKRVARLSSTADSLLFNRAGDRLLMVGIFPAELYNLKTQRRLTFDASRLPETESYRFLGFAADDVTAVATADTYWLRWSPPSPPTALPADYSPGYASLSQDGSRMVMWVWFDQQTQFNIVWDVVTARQIATWPTNEQPDAALQFSPDSRLVFTLSNQYDDGTPKSTTVRAFAWPGLKERWSIRLPYAGDSNTLEVGSGFITLSTDHEILIISNDGVIHRPRGRDRSALPYVGTWWVHGMTLEIKPDFTGTAAWNAGPCPNLTSMCDGYAKERFALTPDGLKATIVSVAYKNEKGEAIPDFPAGPDSPQRGNTYTLERVDRGLLRIREPGKDGNPYLCAPYVAIDLKAKCGA